MGHIGDAEEVVALIDACNGVCTTHESHIPTLHSLVLGEHHKWMD
jgi:hypothetical protein